MKKQNQTLTQKFMTKKWFGVLSFGWLMIFCFQLSANEVNAQSMQSELDPVLNATLTLEEAFEITLQQNHAIRIERMTAEQARNNVTLGNAGRLPVLEVTGGAELTRDNTDLELANFDNPNAGNTSISVDGAQSRTYQAGVNLRYTLFDGFSGRYRYRQLQQFDKTAQLGTRVVIEQTLFDVAQSFVALLEAEEQLMIQRENLEISELRVQRTRDAREFGTARQLDIQNAEVNAGNDRIRVEQALNRRNEAWRNLRFLMGMEDVQSDDSPELVYDYITDTNLELEELLHSALNQNVRIELSLAEVNLAEIQQRLEAGNRFPEISLQGRYGWLQQENDANQLRSLEQNGFTASVNLRYTLFDGFNTRRAVQNAAIERRSREENRIQVMRSVETDLLNTWASFTTQQRALDIAAATVEAAELQFEQAEEARRQGQLSSIELRDTQLSLLSARLQKNQIQNDLRLREIELLILSGGLGY